MSEPIFQKTYNKLLRKLLSSSFLEKYNIDYNLIEEAVKSSEFINSLKFQIADKDYSCKRTLELCKALMEKLSFPNKPENWLYYIYEHALSYSFPEAVDIILLESITPACEFYLRVLRVLSEAQKASNDRTWQSLYPLSFLTSEEEADLERPEEFKRFLKAFKHNYTYEMMKLNGEVFGFNTLDHICGVHYLSMFIARQLKRLGIPIDLGRVSGAAAGHDIGKYGCKRTELKRVPYLHYYYTDQWFKRYNINYIKNIALNHSTWDLELENLSIESLTLIYSDFRVKNNTVNGVTNMHIFTLKDSFQVILEKLDNVDEAKEKRYRKVYEKLKDFEDFLVDLSIETSPDVKKLPSENKNIIKNFSLMQGKELVQNLKYLAINHNIKLMHELRDEYSLDAILEMARSEKDWKNLREYIRIFEEYSTYLTQGQKLQAMNFLYDNLIHPEDDIRRHSAELLGTLIAIFDEDYRKEIPENVKLSEPSVNSFSLLNKYLDLLLFPSHKVISLHRFWLGYSISIMLASMFKACKKKALISYRTIILKYYDENILKNSDSIIFLLETIRVIPFIPYESNMEFIENFIISMLNKRNSSLRLSALESSLDLINRLPNDSSLLNKLKAYLCSKDKRSNIPSENILRYKIAEALSINICSGLFEENSVLYENEISDIFLSNLKTATDWVKKNNQISLLLNHALNSPKGNGLHTAIHFCNLLKVSAVEKVRSNAGNAILTLMSSLNLAERNEVAVELLRALEIEGNKFTEYMPKYIGQIILYLQPKELDEIIDDLKLKIKTSSINVKSLILKTLGITLSNYSVYKTRFSEEDVSHEKRIISMLGVILNALSDYNPKVRQSALRVIGKDLFGTGNLSHPEKEYIFRLIAKKILTMITEITQDELLFLSSCAALNHIYRFISDFSFIYGGLAIPSPEKVAFFPGTFDPFSLSHKEIAKAIRDMGFEVYLAVDEFSWSKKTLPNLIRRKILSMSIADEMSIYVYPQNISTNIANEEDLIALSDSFSGSEVYIAVGSDVVINASSYKKAIGEYSIHNFNHIIFERGKNKKLLEEVKKINGKIEWLTLPSKFSEISSTQIRNYIDENRDISSLIDPLAEQFIYENGFYQSEPQDKYYISSLYLNVEIIENYNEAILEELKALAPIADETIANAVKNTLNNTSGRVVVVRDSNTQEVLGFSLFHWLRSSTLYSDLKDHKLSQYLRDHSLGRIILLHGFITKASEKTRNIEQILLTETLAFCLAKDYQFAVFKNMLPYPVSFSVYELLKLQGFTEINSMDSVNPTFMVNMSTPCILNLDLENVLKEPFRSNPKLKQATLASRKRLQAALCKLYPGELVLSFDSLMLHQAMIKKICQQNKVSTNETVPRKLGEAMCVPYGDILDRYVIPNTVTKALHTEKYFHPDMKDFSIKESPYYLELSTQVNMIKSFRRPIILVDNILHKGYRMKELDPLLKKENIKVEKIISGILSGRGKDLMDMQDRQVDSVYFIPRLKYWFNENSLYAFVGGDSLWRGSFPQRNLLPSVNLIMPYTPPSFMKGADLKWIYNLSKVCLENSLELITTLENEYHLLHERNLTLLNLGQVFTVPRCPDKGNNMNYDYNLSPSNYIRNDLEQLLRYEDIFNHL